MTAARVTFAHYKKTTRTSSVTTTNYVLMGNLEVSAGGWFKKAPVYNFFKSQDFRFICLVLSNQQSNPKDTHTDTNLCERQFKGNTVWPSLTP